MIICWVNKIISDKLTKLSDKLTEVSSWRHFFTCFWKKFPMVSYFCYLHARLFINLSICKMIMFHVDIMVHACTGQWMGSGWHDRKHFTSLTKLINTRVIINSPYQINPSVCPSVCPSVRPKILSSQLLWNYWSNYHETWYVDRTSYGVMHISRKFWSPYFCGFMPLGT